jgi:phosphatidylglycerophosphate synthase
MLVLLMVDWHLGMLERPDGRRLAGLGVANTLTLLRAGAIPLLPALAPTAFGLAVLGDGLSDVADGCLARARGEASRLGAWLDGAVDGVLLSVAAVVAADRALLPIWVAALIVGRYLALWVVIAGVYFATARAPRREGYASGRTLGVVLVVGLTLAALGFREPRSRRPAPHSAVSRRSAPPSSGASVALDQQAPERKQLRRRLLHRESLGRIGMDRLRQAAGEAPSLHRERAVLDELAGVRTDDLGADQLPAADSSEEAASRGHELDEANCSLFDSRPIDAAHRIGDDLDSLVQLARLFFGQAEMRDLGIGERHPGHDALVDPRPFSRSVQPGHAPLVGPDVRELQPAGHVAGGEDVRRARPPARVDPDVAAVELHAERLQPEAADAADAPHRNKEGVAAELVLPSESTISARSVFTAPASAPSRSSTPSPRRTSATTSPASGSSLGNSRSSSSTTAISLPNRRNACASSRPVAPPPRTSNRRGRCSSSKMVRLVRTAPARSRPALAPAGPLPGRDDECPAGDALAGDVELVWREEARLPADELDPRPFEALVALVGRDLLDDPPPAGHDLRVVDGRRGGEDPLRRGPSRVLDHLRDLRAALSTARIRRR